MIKVYLAAAFHRQEEIREIAEELRQEGISVTSRWLEEQECPPGTSERKEFLAHQAQVDLEDIDRADFLVRFSDDLTTPTVPSSWATGSRMGEMMYARSAGKPVIVVGGHQCVFDYLPDVRHVKTVAQLKATLQIFNSNI